MTRAVYKLDREEIDRFNRLQPVPEAAFKFWKNVAESRGLNYKTIISEPQPYTFSAMEKITPRRPWCHPIPLKCSKPPVATKSRTSAVFEAWYNQ